MMPGSRQTGLVIVAAGHSSRMGALRNKVYLPLDHRCVLAHTLDAFADIPVTHCVLVIAPGEQEDAEQAVRQSRYEGPVAIIAGGESRTASVRNGLDALPASTDWVIIHDGARPLASHEMILRCLQSAYQYGSAVAGVPVKDTIKHIDPAGHVLHTPDRKQLWAVQTPQIFPYGDILKAYQNAPGGEYPDDAALMEAIGRPPRIFMGSYRNIKITTPDDITLCRMYLGVEEENPPMRVGLGYDVHRLVEGRALILGGVKIDHGKGLLGHSDADVLVHAVMDALLGAAGLGDIGRHFPDTAKQYQDADSVALLAQVGSLLADKGFRVVNIDTTVVAQQPKLAGFLEEMARNIERALGLPGGCAHVKATTTEGLGFAGQEQGIAAYAAASISSETAIFHASKNERNDYG